MTPKHEVPMMAMKSGDFISIPAFTNHHVDSAFLRGAIRRSIEKMEASRADP
jgi:hypothetical protein